MSLKEFIQNHKIISTLLVIFIIVFVVGTLTNLKEETKTNDLVEDVEVKEDITLSQALSRCSKRTRECDEGVPYIRKELRSVCLQLYYYTGDVKELIDYTNDMC